MRGWPSTHPKKPNNMHRSATRPTLLSILFSLLFCLGCASVPPGGHPRAAQVDAAAKHLQERFGAGDMLGVADLYRSDATILAPGGFRIEGREAIDTHWARLIEPLGWSLKTRSIEGAEDLAYQRGSSTLTWFENGQEQSAKEEFLLLWMRDTQGDWKILLDSRWQRPATR